MASARDAARAGRRSAPPAAPALPRAGLWAALLLALHAGLALWGAARNSVTFDENFHLPAGVVEVTRRDFGISRVNPPLIKALAALPALAAGARAPSDSSVATRDAWVVGASFMRANADRYQRVFFAARALTVALSVLLGFLVWRFARRLHGDRGALLALALYALAPESLAHAGLVTLDLATGLCFFAAVYAFRGFAKSGRWAWWWGTAAAAAALALTRFTATMLVPILALLALLAWRAGGLPRPRRVWIGLALLPVVMLAALDLGYLGGVSARPLASWSFVSGGFQRLQHAAPWLRLPLPDDWLAGLDWQMGDASGGGLPTYFLGRVTTDWIRWYPPAALLFKWPLAFLAALAGRALTAFAWPARGARARDALFLLAPPALFLLSAMFLVNLNVGVRYLFPMLPFLCVWSGGLLPPWARLRGGARAWAPRLPALGAALGLLLALETAGTAPWYLSFFNRAAGGPGGGDRLVNDSNVDWGQGLIALREDLRRLGIGRIHLCYLGTADPALYGIDYLPFTGGRPGPETEYLAISSYYLVGLAQRMVVPGGRTGPIQFDFSSLWGVEPLARPAHCMYVYRVPRPEGGAP